MTTFNRICIKDYERSDETGAKFEIHRGKEYLTSAPHDDGTVTVFTNYWERVPVELFAGAEKFT